MSKNYLYDQVYESCLKYFDGDELAATTWIKKYCLKNNDGTYSELNPDDMHKRMAKEFAKVEHIYDYNTNDDLKLKLSEYGYNRGVLDEEGIYKLFKNFKYVIPGGSVMSGLGNPLPVSLSNCWVIDGPNDSIDDIFRVCNEQSQLMKRRGGVGFDISKLRPYGSIVNNSAKTSTGAVSFMDLFSHVTNTIAQAGRRGALMLSISIKHPDAKEFIEKKQDLTKVTGANISVQIDDEFMRLATSNYDNLYVQRFPIDATNEELFGVDYDDIINSCELNKLYDGKTKNTYFKIINAKELWNDVIHCAWSTAEPGIIFQTNHYDYSPDGVYPSFRGSCTNPCGEIFMHEDSCRLIHINLTSFIDNPFTDNASINDEKLYEITYEAMKLGDDLVDLEADAIRKILAKIENDGDTNNSEYKLYQRLLSHTLEGRRCGLGFTGLADMIAMLGLKYDSEASLSIINHVMRLMFIAEMDSQIDMAITRGNFSAQNMEFEHVGNRWYEFLKNDFNSIYHKMLKYGRRNISFNTVAPTGTVSLMAKCSSGIEPIFLPFYTRRRKCMSDGDRVDFVDQVGEKYTEFVVVHPTFRKWAETYFSELSKETLNEWKLEDWTAAYKLSPWYESTANDINWEKRVELQGIVQKYITHSISSTVNLPNSVTEDEVSNIYIKSWKNQLKGITCYRDGCRSGVLVSTKKESKPETKSLLISMLKDNDLTNEDKKEILYALTEEKKDDNKVCINNQPISKRPKEIPCKIFRFSNKGEKWVGVVGLVDDRPYEIFTGILEKLNIPNWVEDGFIVRNKEKRMVDGEEKLMSRYDLCYIDKDGYRTCVEGLSRTFNPEYWNYAKLISGLLRHRMPLPYLIKIISSLNLDASNINTWKNGVIRTLRKFNDSNIEEGHYETCPECGGRLLNEGGCLHCIDCGYSKCG